jgi:hypothetical protein
MNVLAREKQVEAIAALCEGISMRATERLTGINRGPIRDTIDRLVTLLELRSPDVGYPPACDLPRYG